MQTPTPPSLAAAALGGYAARYGQSVRAMDAAVARTPSGAEVIDLTHGDTRAFTPPASARRDLLAAIDDNAEAYSPYRGSASVRAAVAPRVADLLGRPVDPATELIVTPGTQGGLFAALSALVCPGDVVAMPAVEYFMDERIAAYLGASPHRVEMVYGDDGYARLAEGALEGATRAGAVGLVLSNPNNPTGSVVAEESLAEIAAWARGRDAWVVADQLYCRLVFDDTRLVHLGALEGMAERTVTLLGPSKTESMSGYRVGVAVGPASVVDAMEQVMSMASLRTAGYAQHVLDHWMDGDGAWLEERVTGHRQLRDELVASLRSVPGLAIRAPSASSYVFPDATATPFGRAHDGDDFAMAVAFKEAGVVVSPGYQFGPAGRGHFRINFSQDRRRLGVALTRIATVLSR